MPLDHSWITITYLYCTASAVEGKKRDGGGVGGGAAAVLSIFYVLILVTESGLVFENWWEFRILHEKKKIIKKKNIR